MPEPITPPIEPKATVSDPENLLAVQPATSLPPPNFDDFKANPKPKEAAKPVEPAKVEPKVEGEVQPPAEPDKPKIELPDFQPFNEQPAQVEPKPPTKRELAGKDFTGIDAADIPHVTEIARRMSSESFGEFKKLYVQNKEYTVKLAEIENAKPKEGELPASYYAHPEGYKLSPEFNNLEYVTGIADKLVEHWMEQYEKVQSGEPWINVTVDGKTGQLNYGEPQAVAPVQRARLAAGMLKMVNTSTMQANQLNQQKQQLVQNYQSKISEAQGSINAIRNTFFKGWEAKDHATQPLQKKYLEQVHPSHRDNPYAQLFVMGKIMFDAAQARIKELEAQVTGKKTNALIPPSPKKDETLVPTNGSRVPTMEDFENRKRAA